jgi:trimethylamine--corrinoid protein Co-methyltransferase
MKRSSSKPAAAPRRGGGSAARRARRASDAEAQAGRQDQAARGGAYRPLAERDVERIHHAALEVLEKVGMGDPVPELEELALARGARLTASGRLAFPRALVEDVIAGAGRGFVLHGREPRNDIDLGDGRLHFATNGVPVEVLDFESGRYRRATLLDLYDFARLVDRLDNLDLFGRMVVATDVADLLEHDLNMVYACLAGTAKHLEFGLNSADHVGPVLALLDLALGGEGRFRKRPVCSIGGCPIVSPLRFGAENSRIFLAAARAGFPLNLVVAAQAGATAPAALAGALVQTVAETLAGLILVNLASPGHPIIFGNWPFVSDLRTGAFSGGVAAGMADAKLPDNQAGHEKGVSTALAALAGADIVFESAGMLASLLGASFEALVIDDDMLGAVRRAVRGIEVSDETLSLEVIRDVAEGPGHYLGHPQTLELMQSEYVYPKVGDRSSPGAWEEGGAQDARQRARARARQILGSHYPSYIRPEVDAELRARFPIRLRPEAMRPDCGRW